MFAVAYFLVLSLYSIVFILISKTSPFFMVSGLLLFSYSVGCLYIVGNHHGLYNLQKFLNAYLILLNDITIILISGMLFGNWSWKFTVTIGSFLWSILFFALDCHYVDPNEKLVVETIETCRKRITFIEID